MFVQDNLQSPKVISDVYFPNNIFFKMFTGALIVSLVLLAISRSMPNTLWQSSGLAWTLPAIAILFLISAGTSLIMFRSKSYPGSPMTVSRNFR